MPARSTSPKGRAFLKREEGEVLRAYLDPVHRWTIGAGLTAASGVVVPKSGMVITQEEADRLLTLALERNYEPAVREAMPDASASEFDAGASFHWNTGAIGKASWVGAWAKRDWFAVRDRLLRWSKGGGKVLPGLRKRREREFLLMRDGIYAELEPKAARSPKAARIALPLSAEELRAARDGLGALGYAPGDDTRFIALDAALRFQKDHGLTVDGIVGRATLSTLQRRLDARGKVSKVAVGGSLVGGATATPPTGLELPSWSIWVVVACAGFVVLRLAWTYRDVLAVKLQDRFPRIATWLKEH